MGRVQEEGEKACQRRAELRRRAVLTRDSLGELHGGLVISQRDAIHSKTRLCAIEVEAKARAGEERERSVRSSGAESQSRHAAHQLIQ